MLGDLHVQTSGGVRAGGPGHRPWRTGGSCYPGPYLGRAKSPGPQGASLSPREHASVERQRVPRGWAGWDCPLPPAAPPHAKGPSGGGPTPGPANTPLENRATSCQHLPGLRRGAGRGFGGAGLWRGRGSRGYLTWAAWPPCPLTAPPSGRSPGRPPRLGDSLLGSGLGQSGGPCEPLWVTEVREPADGGPGAHCTFLKADGRSAT